MARFLKQSTAVDVALGPFVDSSDGVTAETGLTISQADVRLKKNNGAWAQVNDNTSATHEENGWYEKELNTTDTDTIGVLIIAVHEAGALPVWHEFVVLDELVYDALFGTVALATTTNITAGTIATVTNVTTVNGLAAGAITAAAIATGAIDADALAADAVTEIQSGLATAAALATVDGIVDAVKLSTDNLPSDPADASVVAGLIAAVDAKIDTIDTNVDAVLADTGTDGVVVAAASKTGYRLSATGVDDVLDEAVEGTRTFRQMLRGFSAALLAKASGLATTTAVYRDIDDSKDRITATVDEDGNRTAITLDLT